MIHRRIFAALALLCVLVAPGWAQTGSPKTPAQLNTEINTLFPNNNLGQITPFALRQVTLDIVANANAQGGFIPGVTLEQYGGGTAKTRAENDTACAALVAANKTGMKFVIGSGTYNFTNGCPAFVATTGVSIGGYHVECQGGGNTIINWTNGSMFTFGTSAPSLFDTNDVSIKGCFLYSPDTTTLKKGVELFSVSGFTREDLTIGGAGVQGQLTGAAGTTGIHYHGHQFFRSIGQNQIFADTAVRYSLNPNNYIAADTVDLNGDYLISVGNPNVVVDPGVLISLTANEGNWVQGTHGLYHADTSAVNIVTAINAAGSGYAAGDFIVLAGGTCSTPIRIKVIKVTLGAIATAAVDNVGVCAVVPTMPAAQASTTGAGTGATITAQNIGGSTFDLSARTEQGTDNTAYSIYVSASNFVQSLKVRNFGMEGFRNGIFIRKVRTTTLQDTNFQAQTSTLGVNTDTLGTMNWSGTWWSNTAAHAINMPLNWAVPDASAGSGLWSAGSWGGTVTGIFDIKQLVAIGSSSGFATIQPQAAAGTPSLLWPTVTGTLVASATLPIVADASTGVASCPTCGVTGSPLSQFASTTSAQLAGVISNETGSGLLVFGTSPNITTPTGIVKGDVGLGNVANVDTTNAANISSGTLPAARMPALTGDITSSVGTVATTLAAGSASNLNSGTLAAARGGAGTITGALKGNGAGVVSQAACADLSNGAGGCATAVGTSGAVIGLLNTANTWSATQTNSAGWLSSSATAGIGYTSGAGGTVTQATNKSTAVTLNKMSGQITMNAAALASNTTVSFLFNNSSLVAGDFVFLAGVTGGTQAAYLIWAEAMTTGSAVVNVRNITGGSLSEAIVIGFYVAKGSTN